MAKKNGTALPEGFRELSNLTDGFFIKEKGNKVRGCYRGSYETEGEYGMRRIHRIELTDGATKISAPDEKGGWSESVAEQGSLISVDETGYLRSLSDVQQGKEVFVRCDGKGKAKKKGQQDPWLFTVAVAE